MPTVYLSNWASHKTPGHHGPGRKFTIMVRPRRWERGEGSVTALKPDGDDLIRVKLDPAWMPEYRRRYEGELQLMSRALAPGRLYAFREHDDATVSDGDTLCCGCSRAVAARGECHRVWAARALLAAGWEVVLDGVRLP